ncbi:MAG: cation:proton antiporter [Gammaproteobacteria bacterium]|nr:cation:proton antiporter [Gammaproteobacteria bacterium]
MEFIWILFAFLCGVSVRLVSLPPMVGYLFAGFLLHFLGLQATSGIEVLSQLGITLMLFTIGLKLNIRDLLKREVIVVSLSNMSLWIVTMSALFFGITALGLYYFAGLDLATVAIITFALSFSSTVCVVKILEESGELKTEHGKLAIAILVMQDIVAVLFLVAATGVLPSLAAFGLLGLLFVKPFLGKVLEKTGHGELLPLLGFFLAFGGYELFKLVGVKGDLGALVMGILISSHPKSTELYKSLMGFKDLFLIGFFLSIGFTALPDLNMTLIAVLLVLFIPIKALLFYGLFNVMNVRTRSSFLSSLVLSNYSEFGLIVAAMSVQQGWLAKEWLVILALAVSFSFVFTSVFYKHAHNIYKNKKELLFRFSRSSQSKDLSIEIPDDTEIMIIGMGRVGKGAYNAACKITELPVIGMDADETRVKKLSESGYQTVYGDGEDCDLWDGLDLSKIKLVLIALPYVQDISNIRQQLSYAGFNGKVAAIARYEDQIAQLKQEGVDRIFNFYEEAGYGFAEESLQLLQETKTS